MEYIEYDRRKKKRMRQRKRQLRIWRMRIAVGTAAVLFMVFIITRMLSPQTTLADDNESRAAMETESMQTGIKGTIVVDPGHGGNDPGCEALNGTLYEKDVNLEIARKLQHELEARGYEVIMTRTADVYVSKETRAEIGSAAGVSAFISIHQNILEQDSVTSGIETWYNGQTDSTSRQLAQLVQAGAVEATGTYDHGTKASEDLYVTRETAAPSCLIETGFLSNPEERDNLLDNTYQQKLIEGIADGIEQFMNEVLNIGTQEE